MIYDNELDYEAKLILATLGEAEDCNYSEKILIACVGWNRFRYRKIFNEIEKDFKGYKRKIVIDNVFTRNAFIESVKAVIEARILVNERKPIYSEVVFFNLHGKLPSSWFELEKVKLKFKTKHHFFKFKENPAI